MRGASAVQIQFFTDTDPNPSCGSGVIIHSCRSSTYILTAAHVLDDLHQAKQASINGREYGVGDLKIEDSAILQDRYDLAILKVKCGHLGPAARIPKRQALLTTGQPVVFTGYFEDRAGLVTKEGTIKEVNVEKGKESIATDIEIKRGASGSPLLSGDRLVIHVLGIILSIEGSMSWAVPLTQDVIDEIHRLIWKRRPAAPVLAAALGLVILTPFMLQFVVSRFASIAYVSVLEPRTDGYYEIFLIDTSGGHLRRATHSPYAEWHVKWSPDGEKIAFASDATGNFDIYVMGSPTRNREKLTSDPANEWCPSWSPDGKRIAFILNEVGTQIPGKRRVYVMDADGTNRRRLTQSAGEEEFRPAWSPDGRSIAFTSNRDGEWQIYVMNADGEKTSLTKLTAIPGGAQRPAWSPDGKKIAFDSNGDIWVMKADGGQQLALTQDGNGNGYPAWSPDGRKIIFQSHRDGNAEIYIMDADGSNQHALTFNSTNDWEPDWQPTPHFWQLGSLFRRLWNLFF